MKHFSTLTDKNYLVYGLALYESIKRHISDDFTLHYLALDEETYNTLNEIGDKRIVLYTLIDLEGEELYDVLIKNKIDPNGVSPFHYALASFFTFYLFRKKHLPECLYVDSDIFFYKDPLVIFETVKNHSIGLMVHKHLALTKNIRGPGYYNVGVVYFKNDKIGYHCLEWWKSVACNPQNKWAAVYGSCGDQKYLELFGDFFGENNIKILDMEVGNLGPWNISMMEFPDNRFDENDIDNYIIKWNDPRRNVIKYGPDFLIQELVFMHFSHFSCDEDSYKKDWDNEWGNILWHPAKEGRNGDKIYQHYAKHIREARKEYNLV